MSRYFFDLLDDLDASGVEFDSAAAAKEEAIRFAGEILSDGKVPLTHGYWGMVVRHENGAVVARLSFYVS